MSIFQELKRRNVFRVGTAYVVAAWVIVEVSSLILGIYDYPESVMRLLVALLALGLPFVLFFAWAFEVTPEGIKRDADVDRTAGQASLRARRLSLITIALLVIAICLLAIDRFVAAPGKAESSATETTSGQDSESLARTMLEINRLRDEGNYPAAFALATDVAPLLGESGFDEEFWEEISVTTGISTDPPGARVYQSTMDADPDDWEELGVTPLANVRFSRSQGYRVRFELDGYRPVEMLHGLLTGSEIYGHPPMNPVKLDREESIAEGMVRIRGFSHDLVDYGDFFMDRFELTNREFEKFVTAGGYRNPEYWEESFTRDGEEVPFEQAMQAFIDRTGRAGPATWSGGVYPSGQGDYPVGGISWYEAAAYANYVDKALPTAVHLDRAKEFFRENSWLVAPRSNLEADGPWPVGQNRAMTTTGIYDMVGNVREWIWNESGEDQRGTTGAAWTDAAYHGGWIIPKSPWDRDETNGTRLVRTLDAEEKLDRLRARYDPELRRDFMSETPASDAEFEIYKRLYAYDPLPLNAEVVYEQEHEHWIRQRVDFDLPYGERGGAFLYIPKNLDTSANPIVLWSGSGYLGLQANEDEGWTSVFDFLIRSGRMVVLPVFKGSYDRDDADFSITHGRLLSNSGGTQYRDIQVKWIQDLSRTIDYLQSRDDVDATSVGYAGHSWGGQTAPIVLSLEERIGAAVLHVGGLWEYYQFLPEGDPLNFVTRVRTPVLMLNGQYDIVFPYETGQLPMYEMLGTPPEHTKHVVTPGAHLVSRDVLIRETLDWFERYLN